jgi:hypothetical protein
MFGSERLTGGFDIIIRSLKQGKIWWIHVQLKVERVRYR